MRTGAIFARGSCRALKWMLVLGAFSVLGSAQATAQPTIQMAEYASNNTRVITVTTNVPVYLDEGTLQALAADFTLSGGAITGSQGPLEVVRLPITSVPGSTTFDLRFASTIAALRGPGTTGLTLAYSADAGRTILQSGTTTPAMASTTDPHIAVTGPDDDTELTLEIPAATKMALQEILRVGADFTAVELPVATGTTETVTYNTRGLPPGLIVVANTTDDDVAFDLGVADAAGTALATNAAGDNVGALPDNIGTYPVVYSATAGDESAEDSFTITLANTPEAVTGLSVVAAGPSSLKVTWAAGSHNNATIISYDLQYKATGTPDTDAAWLDALLPRAVVASKSYTIEGLAPGDYDVRVRATNILGDSIWEMASGSTGAGPGKPTLTVTVDSTIPEDRDRIPVTVMATVPPSATSPRNLVVTLALKVDGTAEERAEVPNTAGIDPDVNWDGAGATAATTTLSFAFDSNLSSEKTAYLNTHGDEDAEPESFKIEATTKAVAGVFSAAAKVTKKVKIHDDEDQEYRLRLDDVALESSGMFPEGHGDEPVEMTLIVSPARTLPKSFFVNLESAQDARDYSLSSGGTSSGGPTAVSLRIDMAAGQETEPITLTAASNDGDRVDDTITLQVFETSATSPTTAGGIVEEATVMLTVVDQHKLPKVTMGSIMVDGAAVTRLKEGQTGTVTLMADRGSPTDDIPDGEKITVALTHGAASSASAADYSLSSEMVTITGTSGTFMLEVLEDDEIDAEELVLQGAVTGVAMYGGSEGAANNMVDVGPISLMDGTTKLVYPKTDEEIQAVIYPAKEAGMGDDMTFNPGEMIKIASPGALFNNAEGVTLSFSAMSDHDHVATTSVSGGMVTVTAGDEEGMAHITITAHASMAAGAKGLPQTDPSEASIIFPVEVGLEALSFTLTGPEEMNLVEGGMGGMVTATANRAVTADVTINLMRDRAMSTADDMDFTAEAITIEAGMMSGTTMVMAAADEMMENEGNMAEELVLYGMAADNAGEVTGQVKFYIWDAAVPALPIIAQLLLAAFLAIGGYRRYRRR